VRASLNREEISKCGKGKFIPGINELRITPWRRIEKWRYSSYRFIPGEIVPSAYCIGGLSGPYEEEKCRLPLPGIESRLVGRPVTSLVAIAT
jgi:hypothetical protein